MPVHTDYAGTFYPHGLDLAEETIDGHLSLRYMKRHDPVSLRDATIGGHTHLAGSTLNDQLDAAGLETGGILDMERASIYADVSLHGAETTQLYAKDLQVEGTLDLTEAAVGTAFLTRAHVEALRLDGTDTDRIDLRGATVDELYVDVLDDYELRTDDKTYLGRVYEGAVHEPVALSDRERAVLAGIMEERAHDGGGAVFTYEQLGEAAACDPAYCGAFGSLVRKGVIRELEEGRYVARADPLQHGPAPAEDV